MRIATAKEGEADTVAFPSLGPPIPGVTLRIVDSDRHVLPEEAIGQLEVRGEPVARGYYDDANASNAFRSDGWFQTGDMGFVAEGELYLTGRAKECIILNGANYYCGEIEEAVEAVAGVEPTYSAACAVRRPGDEVERLVIFFHTSVVEDGGLQDLLRSVRQRVVRQIGVRPDYLIPLDKTEIPKTAVGKLQRRQLAERFAAGSFDAIVERLDLMRAAETARGQVAPRTDVEARIAQIWRDVLGVSRIGVDDNIFELGGNSILLMQIHSQLETSFGSVLSVVDMFNHPTVGTLARFLSGSEATDGPSPPAQQGRERATARRRSSRGGEVAVIGLACRFPDADSPDQFWRNLRDGRESITSFSKADALAAGIDPGLVQDPRYVFAAPLLDNVEDFDAEFFGYNRREAEVLDPQQRIMLECAWEALEDAGYDPYRYTGSIGVFAGAVLNTYLVNYVLGRGGRSPGAPRAGAHAQFGGRF